MVLWYFAGGFVQSDDEEDTEEGTVDLDEYQAIDESVRVFKPIINIKASVYYGMTPYTQWKTPPRVLSQYDNECIRSLEKNPLKLGFEYHSQNVKRHIELITESVGAVCGHEKRDRLIRNTRLDRASWWRTLFPKNTSMFHSLIK